MPCPPRHHGGREEIKDTSASMPPFGPFLHGLLAVMTAAVFAAALAAPAMALQPFFLVATAVGFITGSRLPPYLPAMVNRVRTPPPPPACVAVLVAVAVGTGVGWVGWVAVAGGGSGGEGGGLSRGYIYRV
jgi:hypothetical protein